MPAAGQAAGQSTPSASSASFNHAALLDVSMDTGKRHLSFDSSLILL
jgi:hypothetical protein